MSDSASGQSQLVIPPDVFSIILLSDGVLGRSQLVTSPVFSIIVFSIILLLDCVSGQSQNCDTTRCVLYNSAVNLCTRSITTGDFMRCVLCKSAIRF